VSNLGFADTLKALREKATDGEWSIPHLSRVDITCNCPYILAEGYCGSIADISVDNGKKISEGGNDSPPLSEAKANGELIAFLVNNAGKIVELIKAAELTVKSEALNENDELVWALNELEKVTP